jgi:phospholipid-transporting ATPase
VCGGVGGVGGWGHSLRSTFHRLRLLRLWTPTILKYTYFFILAGELQCEQPNRRIYEFNGNIRLDEAETNPLTPSAVLLRGAKLNNTDWIYGIVIYSGHETKLLMNSTKAPLKRSNIDKITNNQIIFLFIILLVMAFASALGSEIIRNNGNVHDYVSGASADNRPQQLSETVSNFFFNVLTFIILYNNLIPISLQVSLEFVKFIQAYYMNMDEDMYHVETDTYANARTSNLNEELGQIKYVFSDKTGTLTQNIMEFKDCSIGKLSINAKKSLKFKIQPTLDTLTKNVDCKQKKIKFFSAGIKYGVTPSTSRASPSDELLSPDAIVSESSPHNLPLVINLLNNHSTSEEIRTFLLIMAVCHTVIPERDEESGNIVYNASSPDEKALIEGAALYGYKFSHRKPDSVIVSISDHVDEEYQILDTIEFTSSRKRMSCIVRCPDGKIRLFIKGADMMIIDKLGADDQFHKKHLQVTLDHMDEFACNGLRTLCLATKDISDPDYQVWKREFQEASNSIDEREERIDEVAAKLERDLVLLGATAIEDKLQDGVPDTIADLLKANIKVWVLTGDKQETAINIGHSCRLLSRDIPLIILNSPTLDRTRSEITEELFKFQHENENGE